MVRTVWWLVLALLLASCSAVVDGGTDSANAADDGCMPGAFPDTSQGVIWLDEDVDTEDPIWIAQELDASVFVDWHRFVDVDDIQADEEVMAFLEVHATDELPADNRRQLFFVTMEALASQESVDSVFDGFGYLKGVSEVVVGPPTC